MFLVLENTNTGSCFQVPIFVFSSTDIRVFKYRYSCFQVPTRPLVLVAVGRKGHRKGFKVFKGLKEKKGGRTSPLFLKGKKARPEGADTPLCGGSVRGNDAR